MDNIQIHIWQLSEKTDKLDSENDIMMVHDRYALKKTSIKKLFEYFNQDYKVDSTIAYFDKQMKDIDDKYLVSYGVVETSQDQYESTSEELSNKFMVIKENIHEIEVSMNKMYSVIVSIEKGLPTLENRESDLFEALWTLSSNLVNLEERLDSVLNTLNEYDSLLDEKTNEYIQLESDTNSVYTKIEEITEHINSNKNNKTHEIIQKINSEYDKILAILDYYHHIHE